MNAAAAAAETPTAPETAPEPRVLKVVNMAKFEERFAQVARRAKRLKVELPTFSVIGSHQEYEFEHEGDHEGVGYAWAKKRQIGGDWRATGAVRTVQHVTLGGLAVVKLAGWTFVATLDHELGEENTIVRTIPGGELPSTYRHRGNVCDHCQRSARRNMTYVVRHEDGRLAQVGSTCIRDFLGTDVAAALAYIDMAAAVGGLMDEDFCGGRSPDRFELTEYLAWVAKAIREGGWLSRSAARDSIDGHLPTADVAQMLMLKYRNQRK